MKDENLLGLYLNLSDRLGTEHFNIFGDVYGSIRRFKNSWLNVEYHEERGLIGIYYNHNGILEEKINVIRNDDDILIMLLVSNDREYRTLGDDSTIVDNLFKEIIILKEGCKLKEKRNLLN